MAVSRQAGSLFYFIWLWCVVRPRGIDSSIPRLSLDGSPRARHVAELHEEAAAEGDGHLVGQALAPALGRQRAPEGVHPRDIEERVLMWVLGCVGLGVWVGE